MIAELENATQGDITWALNQWEDATFTLPATDPKSEAVLAERVREVQMWRGDQLLFQGPMVRPSVSKTRVQVSVKGAAWYLSRRNIGKPATNHLVNPSFENGLTGWTVMKAHTLLDWQPVGSAASSVAGSGLTIVPKDGDRALGVASGFDDQGDGSVIVFQEFTVNGGQRGRTATLVAWSAIDSTYYLGPSVTQRGVVLGRYKTDYRTNNWFTINAPSQNTWGGLRGLYTEVVEFTSSRLDEKEPKDLWVRHECSITVPAGHTEIVHARVESASFIHLWDKASLTFDDALEAFNTDQSTIVDLLVTHAQDSTLGKSDVNLTVDPTPTGVKRDYVGLYQAHANIWREIEQFTEPSDGVDISTIYTPTTRTLKVHYPQQGIERPNLTIDLTRNIETFSWTWDGETAANVVVVLGNGDGSDREEATATAAGVFAGDLTLEDVYSAPQSTPIESLPAIATERVTISQFPEVLNVDLREDIFGQFGIGDYLPVRIRQTGLTLTDWYRVVRLTLMSDDRLRLTLNRRDQ